MVKETRKMYLKELDRRVKVIEHKWGTGYVRGTNNPDAISKLDDMYSTLYPSLNVKGLPIEEKIKKLEGEVAAAEVAAAKAD